MFSEEELEELLDRSDLTEETGKTLTENSSNINTFKMNTMKRNRCKWSYCTCVDNEPVYLLGQPFGCIYYTHVISDMSFCVFG